MVQIGAFDSNALAEGEWNRVSGKFGSLFSGKAQVIQKAESGGRNFWRLRAAGFESRDEARRFCAALIAEGIDCIPATAK
ncbi:SPOR domain-containing protein [Paracoccus cavernae]|uniref:SPOR domain-containing protein n=2 Tax=Paracoccus cavernae TaxID=1571207 RepID=A0ABT8D5X8_9RHOB|nr:SPOR domain-containing protein [Paracoccus cavernae]